MEACEELQCPCVEKLLQSVKPGGDDDRARKGVSSQELQRPTQPLLRGACVVRQNSGCPVRVMGTLIFTLVDYQTPDIYSVSQSRVMYSAVPRKLASRKGCHEVSLIDRGRRESDRSDGLSSQWAWKFSISPNTRSMSFGKWCQCSALHMAPSLCEQSTG